MSKEANRPLVHRIFPDRQQRVLSKLGGSLDLSGVGKSFEPGIISGHMFRRIGHWFCFWAKVIWRSVLKFIDTDGSSRAASFAYFAIFALFPLILLFVMVGSHWFKEDAMNRVMDVVAPYIPSVAEGESRNAVLDTVDAFIKARRPASAVAFIIMVWGGLGFFHALVHGVNRAWGTQEYAWWRLPMQNLLMVGILGSALLIGIVLPPILRAVEAFVSKHSVLNASAIASIFVVPRLLVPNIILFYGLTMFYKFAPRRRTQFSEVWPAALLVTAGLQLVQAAFVLYVRNFYNFNAIYGTFGSVIALLMWIYLSGSVILWGGCLSAAQFEVVAERISRENVQREKATGES